MNATTTSINDDLMFHTKLRQGYSSKVLDNGGSLIADDTFDAPAGDSPSCSISENHHSSGKTSVESKDEGIKQWEKFDVLWGRSGDTRTHHGNIFFRTLVNQYRELYMNSPRKLRTLISEKIVRTVRAKGGRFLKQDPDSLLWFETGDSKALEKTSQALRQRKMLEKMLLNRARERSEETAAQHQHDPFNKQVPSLLLNSSITPQLQTNQLLLPSTGTLSPTTQTLAQPPSSALAQLLAMKTGNPAATSSSVADVLRNPLLFTIQGNSAGGRLAPPPGLLSQTTRVPSPTQFQNPHLLFN